MTKLEFDDLAHGIGVCLGVALGIAVLWLLGTLPGRIARVRRHQSAEGIKMLGMGSAIAAAVLGAVSPILSPLGIMAWLVALAWAASGREGAPPENESPGLFDVEGVDRESGLDTRLVVEAASPANAKIKAELRGVIVSRVTRAT